MSILSIRILNSHHQVRKGLQNENMFFGILHCYAKCNAKQFLFGEKQVIGSNPDKNILHFSEEVLSKI